MGENGNRILMALLLGVVIVWTVRFLFEDSHLFFHDQVAGKDYPIIGEIDGGPLVSLAEEPAPICQLLADADIGIGETIAKANCVACHQFNNEIHGQGPHLVGVVGRDVANTNFGGYSAALKGVGGKWDYEGLNAFLHKPSQYVPGTAMNFAGWKNAKIQQRANIIAYLYSVSGADLPECPVIEEQSEEEQDAAEGDSENANTAEG